MANKTSKKLTSGARGEINGVEFEVGSVNIFADFGLPDAEEQLATTPDSKKPAQHKLLQGLTLQSRGDWI